jgi:hypothetical protein
LADRCRDHSYRPDWLPWLFENINQKKVVLCEVSPKRLLEFVKIMPRRRLVEDEEPAVGFKKPAYLGKLQCRIHPKHVDVEKEDLVERRFRQGTVEKIAM